MTNADLIIKMMECTEISPPLSYSEINDFINCAWPPNPKWQEFENRQAFEQKEKEWGRTDYPTKKRINEEIKKTNKEIEAWMELKRGKKSFLADYEIEKCLDKKQKLKKRLGYIGKIKPSDDKTRAKLVSIESFLQFTNGFTACVFHKLPGEKSETPSLKYYPADNHVYCFSCTKRADAIDCMMAKEQIDFNSAVKRLLNT